MQLSLRLKKIAELVDKGSIVADIGCDHALLSIYLVKEGIACKVYAIDNKKEPLQSALNNISEYGLTKYITPCLQDGMSKLEKDVDVAVMAGIGGLLAIEILKKN